MADTEVHIQRSKLGDLSSKVKDAAGMDDDEELKEYIDTKVEKAVDKTGEAAEKAQSFGGSVADGAQNSLDDLKDSRAGSTASDIAPEWSPNS